MKKLTKNKLVVLRAYLFTDDEKITTAFDKENDAFTATNREMLVELSVRQKGENFEVQFNVAD